MNPLIYWWLGTDCDDYEDLLFWDCGHCCCSSWWWDKWDNTLHCISLSVNGRWLKQEIYHFQYLRSLGDFKFKIYQFHFLRSFGDFNFKIYQFHNFRSSGDFSILVIYRFWFHWKILTSISISFICRKGFQENMRTN